MGRQDFRIDIFNRDMQWVAPLGNFKALRSTIRWRGISETSITLPGNHHRIAAMSDEGARLRINFRRETLMTGMIRPVSGVGPGVAGDYVFSCQSDYRLMHNFLGWPAPGLPPDRQGEDDAYYTIGRAPLETIIKDIVRRNVVERSQIPIVIAPDLGRGPVTEVTFRMHPMIDRLQPALEASSLGITVEMKDGALHLDVVEPKPYLQPLTERSRVIQKWGFSRNPPEATRGIVGAQGEGQAREFIPFRDAAREALWGDVIEVFRDARDTSESATHAIRAAEALEDTRATASLTVELAESGNFRVFGPKGVRPGSLVTARVGSRTEVTNVLSEVSVTYDAANGLQISSTIGPKDDPDELIMQAITALAKALTDLKVST
ncbi:hypothetical protein V6S67_07885 [Arthrobacter sp. Soc17.1.1.1]|uniref:Gp37-like protein n=1 Tax=Arthrobacter sp. Soc17.1.1.1 TaxID=3121277 RepID=UPI002FE4998A